MRTESLFSKQPSRINRRSLLKMAAAGAVSVSAVSLLAACADDDDDEPDTSVADTDEEPDSDDAVDDEAATDDEDPADDATADDEVTTPEAPSDLEGTLIRALVPSVGSIGDGFMRAQAEEFESLTGIEVEISFLPFERVMERQITIASAESSELDVFGTHYAQIGRFGQSMVPLNDLADRDGIIQDNYVAGSFEYLSVDGNLLGIPSSFDARSLLYRTDLFEEAGIDSPPETWDEFLETALAVNDPPDIYGVITVGRGDPALREFSDLLWENGGDYLEDGLEPSRPIWNEEEGVEALTWYRDLIWEHEVAPQGTPAYGWEENGSLFATGQGAMSKQWGIAQMENPEESTIIGNYGVAPLLRNVVQRSNALCHARGINLHSENQDAAWEYVKFVTSREQQFTAWEAGALARPAQVEALDDARENADGIVQEHLEVSLAQAETGYTWPLFPQFAEIQPILWGEIERVLSGQAEPQEALDRAAQEAERIFERDGLI